MQYINSGIRWLAGDTSSSSPRNNNHHRAATRKSASLYFLKDAPQLGILRLRHSATARDTAAELQRAQQQYQKQQHPAAAAPFSISCVLNLSSIDATREEELLTNVFGTVAVALCDMSPASHTGLDGLNWLSLFAAMLHQHFAGASSSSSSNNKVILVTDVESPSHPDAQPLCKLLRKSYVVTPRPGPYNLQYVCKCKLKWAGQKPGLRWVPLVQKWRFCAPRGALNSFPPT